jgi:multiple sugar transport system ATP-binding protein
MVYVTHDQVEAMTLADRIVLLRPQDGADAAPSIAQAGAPLALYHRPANRFVAGFIGSPAMNFLPAAVSGGAGDGLSLHIAGQAWTAQVDATGLAADEALTAGIRPEHVRLGDGPLHARVAHVEHLGEHGIAYLALDGAPADAPPLLAKTADEGLRAGDELALAFPPEHLHVFRADGRALPRRA